MAPPVLITDKVKTDIAKAISEARKTPLPADVFMEVAKGIPQGKTVVRLADRKPDFVRPESQHVLIPVGYRASISFEEQPTGLVRHLSVSVYGKPGDCPTPPAVRMIAQEFGIECGENWNDVLIWVEEYELGYFAINVVALDPSQPTETVH